MLAARLQVTGLDITRSAVSKMETRVASITEIRLLHLAEAFGVSVTELYPRREPSEHIHSYFERYGISLD